MSLKPTPTPSHAPFFPPGIASHKVLKKPISAKRPQSVKDCKNMSKLKTGTMSSSLYNYSDPPAVLRRLSKSTPNLKECHLTEGCFISSLTHLSGDPNLNKQLSRSLNRLPEVNKSKIVTGFKPDKPFYPPSKYPSIHDQNNDNIQRLIETRNKYKTPESRNSFQLLVRSQSIQHIERKTYINNSQNKQSGGLQKDASSHRSLPNLNKKAKEISLKDKKVLNGKKNDSRMSDKNQSNQMSTSYFYPRHGILKSNDLMIQSLHMERSLASKISTGSLDRAKGTNQFQNPTEIIEMDDNSTKSVTTPKLLNSFSQDSLDGHRVKKKHLDDINHEFVDRGPFTGYQDEDVTLNSQADISNQASPLVEDRLNELCSNEPHTDSSYQDRYLLHIRDSESRCIGDSDQYNIDQTTSQNYCTDGFNGFTFVDKNVPISIHNEFLSDTDIIQNDKEMFDNPYHTDDKAGEDMNQLLKEIVEFTDSGEKGSVRNNDECLPKEVTCNYFFNNYCADISDSDFNIDGESSFDKQRANNDFFNQNLVDLHDNFPNPLTFAIQNDCNEPQLKIKSVSSINDASIQNIEGTIDQFCANEEDGDIILMEHIDCDFIDKISTGDNNQEDLLNYNHTQDPDHVYDQPILSDNNVKREALSSDDVLCKDEFCDGPTDLEQIKQHNGEYSGLCDEILGNNQRGSGAESTLKPFLRDYYHNGSCGVIDKVEENMSSQYSREQGDTDSTASSSTHDLSWNGCSENRLFEDKLGNYGQSWLSSPELHNGSCSFPGSGTHRLQLYDPLKPLCNSCHKPAYFMERISISNIIFHKSCFRCCKCKTHLNFNNCIIHHKKAYCQVHMKPKIRRSVRSASTNKLNQIKARLDNKTNINTQPDDESKHQKRIIYNGIQSAKTKFFEEATKLNDIKVRDLKRMTPLNQAANHGVVENEPKSRDPNIISGGHNKTSYNEDISVLTQSSSTKETRSHFQDLQNKTHISKISDSNDGDDAIRCSRADVISVDTKSLRNKFLLSSNDSGAKLKKINPADEIKHLIQLSSNSKNDNESEINNEGLNNECSNGDITETPISRNRAKEIKDMFSNFAQDEKLNKPEFKLEYGEGGIYESNPQENNEDVVKYNYDTNVYLPKNTVKSGLQRIKDLQEIKSKGYQKSDNERFILDVDHSLSGVYESTPEQSKADTMAYHKEDKMIEFQNKSYTNDAKTAFLEKQKQENEISSKPSTLNMFKFEYGEGGIYESIPQENSDDVVKYNYDTTINLPENAVKGGLQRIKDLQEIKSKGHQKTTNEPFKLEVDNSLSGVFESTPQQSKADSLSYQNEDNMKEFRDKNYTNEAKKVLLEKRRQEEELESNRSTPHIIDIWKDLCQDSGIFENQPSEQREDVVKYDHCTDKLVIKNEDNKCNKSVELEEIHEDDSHDGN